MNVKLFGQSLHRICLLKHVTEGNIEGRIQVAGTQRAIYKHLLDLGKLYVVKHNCFT